MSLRQKYSALRERLLPMNKLLLIFLSLSLSAPALAATTYDCASATDSETLRFSVLSKAEYSTAFPKVSSSTLASKKPKATR